MRVCGLHLLARLALVACVVSLVFFQTDFMMVLLKDMVLTYPELRVVLMSATVDTSLFSEYFGNAPIVEVHGRVHPVQGLYHTVYFLFLISFSPSHLSKLHLYAESDGIPIKC